MVQFETFKRCIQELTFMNKQYISYKQNIKNKRNTNFTEFYKQSLKTKEPEKKLLNSENKNANKALPEPKKESLLEKFGQLLTSDKPSEIDSLISEDIQEMSSLFARSGLDNVRAISTNFIFHFYFVYINWKLLARMRFLANS